MITLNDLDRYNLSNDYFQIVNRDLKELKLFYPYVKIIYIPTKVPSLIVLEVIAVSKDIIDKTHATEDDLRLQYSKKITVIIPKDYPNSNCYIYGAGWLDLEKIPYEDRHCYREVGNELQLCVGVPQSAVNLKNVLLENIRTAENWLIAYEKLQKGDCYKLELKAYSHGYDGEQEYRRDKTKYITRKNRK